MLELLGGIFSAATGGGALGLLGGLARQALDYFHKREEIANELAVLKERNAHELLMRDKDRELLEAESASQFKMAEIQGETTIEAARLGAVAASFASDRATYATGQIAANSPWFIAVDFLRGIIRPGVTLLFDFALLVIWGLLAWHLAPILMELFASREPAVLKPLLDQFFEITKAIIFLATTTTGYWFVARTGGGTPK